VEKVGEIFLILVCIQNFDDGGGSRERGEDYVARGRIGSEQRNGVDVGYNHALCARKIFWMMCG
jgi:hypothetical protein